MSNIELLDLAPTTEHFLQDVLDGLSQSPKKLEPKYFYDERGSQLFDDICNLDEYYLTRTELAIMQQRIEEMARCVGPRCVLVEFGSGSGLKTELLLSGLDRPAAYVPVEISREFLEQSAARIQQQHPELNVLPVCADFMQQVQLPELPEDAGRTVVFFPGSTIGNFELDEAGQLLAHMAEVAGPDGGLLIGADLRKDRDILEAAYNDAAGVTSAFNLNLLQRINRELDGDFELEAFRHRANYDARIGRVEMHLESLRDQVVTIAQETFAFEAGETIHTENSHKYRLEQFRELAAEAGWTVEQVWTDERQWFSVQYCHAR